VDTKVLLEFKKIKSPYKDWSPTHKFWEFSRLQSNFSKLSKTPHILLKFTVWITKFLSKFFCLSL